MATKSPVPAAVLAEARAREQAANKVLHTAQTALWTAERAQVGADEIGRFQAARDLPSLRLKVAEAQIAAASARQERVDAEPAVRDDREAFYGPRVRAKVRELDDALEQVRVVNAELQSLGNQARSDSAAAAYWCELAWSEFGDIDRPNRDYRLNTWRGALRRNGWL